MEELCIAVGKGEQSLSWQVFQAAVEECQSAGGDTCAGHGEEMATAVGGTAGLQGMEGECCGSSSKQARSGEVEVTLENKELWKQFDKSTNEMIVTKAGRYNSYTALEHSAIAI